MNVSPAWMRALAMGSQIALLGVPTPQLGHTPAFVNQLLLSHLPLIKKLALVSEIWISDLNPVLFIGGGAKSVSLLPMLWFCRYR